MLLVMRRVGSCVELVVSCPSVFVLCVVFVLFASLGVARIVRFIVLPSSRGFQAGGSLCASSLEFMLSGRLSISMASRITRCRSLLSFARSFVF